ncbi:MAG TPA: histidine phosphatase family protein [Kofleriaceae bacterium]|jgi:probable phosphoglycerate mutase
MILLARHGETEWNAIGRLQGHTDVELNDNGRAQARALAAELAAANIASVWTSDLARARETGAIVAAALGLDPPRALADLRERRFGVFEGLTRDECAARYPDAWRAWTSRTEHPPGGESREDATARMARGIDRVRGEAGTALIVTHGGVMRLWIANVTGEAVPLVANGAVYTVEHDGAAVRCALRARA